MAITNHERVVKVLDPLKEGLAPSFGAEVQEAIESGEQNAHKLRRNADAPMLADKPIPDWNVAGLLKLRTDVINRYTNH